jgi:hypothetical protein
MPLYAKTERLKRRQVAADLAMAAWTVVWAGLGLALRHLLVAFAEGAQQMADSAATAAERLTATAQALGQTPVIGSTLRDPFDQMAAGYAQTATGAGQVAALLSQTAVVAAIVVFVVALAVGLAVWLPRRLRFVTGPGPAQAVVAAPRGLELYALRALVTAPAEELARISSDPLAAWQAGDPRVIAELASWALARDGLEPPSVPPQVPPAPGARPVEP